MLRDLFLSQLASVILRSTIRRASPCLACSLGRLGTRSFPEVDGGAGGRRHVGGQQVV
jgi:hypothetical protein